MSNVVLKVNDREYRLDVGPKTPLIYVLRNELGLKGKRRGGAVVSEVHANFIVNRGGATAADILGLMKEVKSAVERATGLVLEEEVALWEPSGEDA